MTSTCSWVSYTWALFKYLFLILYSYWNKLIVSWIDVIFIHCMYRLLWTSIWTEVVRLDLTNDHRWSSCRLCSIHFLFKHIAHSELTTRITLVNKRIFKQVQSRPRRRMNRKSNRNSVYKVQINLWSGLNIFDSFVEHNPRLHRTYSMDIKATPSCPRVIVSRCLR
jgi:hypothetical protein